jgi:hypothetical protein
VRRFDYCVVAIRISARKPTSIIGGLTPLGLKSHSQLNHHHHHAAASSASARFVAAFRTHYLQSIGPEARLPVSALFKDGLFANPANIYPKRLSI